MRHEKVYPDTALKVGDEVYYQGRWQEIYGFGESGTHLSWDGWTCRTKFQVEREVEMSEPIKVARELLNLTKEIHDHSDKQEKLICDMSSLIEKQDEKIKVLETEIVGWKDQWHCDTARINQLSAAYAEKVTEIRELKKANSELASAAISKDEVLCEFVPMNASVCPNHSGCYTVNMDDGRFISDDLALVQFTSNDYVHKPYAKIKVVREVTND